MAPEGRKEKRCITDREKLRRRIALLEKSAARLKQMGEVLADSEAYLRAIMDSIPAGVMVIDPAKHRIVDINRAAATLIGEPKKRIIGKKCHQYVCAAEKGRCPITDLMQVVDNSERVLLDARGKEIPVIKTVMPITFREHKYLIETFIDIRGRKKMDEELKRLATTDILTGAYNRTLFDEIIGREIERVKRYRNPLSVIMLDVDNFKQVNDTFGHNAGDSVLKKIADIVRRVMRKVDYFMRWGGEEFLIISAETDREQAYTLAERIRKRIGKYKFDHIEKITISCGVAEYRARDSENSLIKRADDAMYTAKRAGRNRVVVF